VAGMLKINAILHSMKKLILIVLVLVLLGGSYYVSKNKKTITQDPLINQYVDKETGISFTYPKILSVSNTAGVTTLHHDIPYQNNGACDMKGDTEIYDRLTDFEMTVRVVDKNLVNTVKTLSPYIPQENFADNRLVISRGFIDSYSVGSLSGFSIYEGVGGCGQTTYYFPIESEKTLVIANASIQALSGVIAQEKVAEVLAVPGVISREKNKEIFESIVKSLKVGFED